MARKSGTRAAQGNGTIRRRTVTRKGSTYTYWEARITVGRDPGTNKQIQRSFTGKTQAEVLKKMQAASVEIETGTYQEPVKITLAEWLDTWVAEYLTDVKPRTLDSYKTTIKTHIKPALGAVKLQALKAPQIQRFYNKLSKEGVKVAKHDSGGKIVKKNGKTVYETIPMSPKSIKNAHGVLHKALQQAVEIGYIRTNPADACKLPRIEKTEVKPLDSEQITRFLQVIHGHPFENVYLVTLFTGMREGEVLGLTWGCIDFETNSITIKQQLMRERGKGTYTLATPKNGKSRCITAAATVMQILKQERTRQAEAKLRAGMLWDNPLDLVFTNELGRNLSAQTVYLHFKKLAEKAGVPSARFHDLRHSYAVAALQSGDDIKTVQENLGHFSASFTLDVYGHVTEKMKQASADRMEQFIKGVSGA